MTEKIQNFLRGASSVLFPVQSARTHEKLYRPADSAREALKRDFERVGEDMRRAIEKVGRGEE